MPVKEEQPLQEQPDMGGLDLFKKREQVPVNRYLKMFVWGKAGLGKSFLGLSCPETVWVISTEPGSVEPLFTHFPPEKDIRILNCEMPYSDKPKYAKTGKTDDSVGAIDPETPLRQFERATEALENVTAGTIVIDSVTDLWEWFTAWIPYHAEKFNKDGSMMRTEWGRVNKKYKNFLNRLMSRDCHFIMTGRSENVYDSSGHETTIQKFSGQKKTDYVPNIVMELKQEPKNKVDSSGNIISTEVQVVGTITKARGLNESAVGLKIERPTYDKIKEILNKHGGNFE